MRKIRRDILYLHNFSPKNYHVNNLSIMKENEISIFITACTDKVYLQCFNVLRLFQNSMYYQQFGRHKITCWDIMLIYRVIELKNFIEFLKYRYQVTDPSPVKLQCSFFQSSYLLSKILFQHLLSLFSRLYLGLGQYNTLTSIDNINKLITKFGMK